MAIEEQKVKIFSCDDPGCATRIVCETEELPDGFHGKVLEVGSFGGRDAEWFACRPTHIRGAVEHSLVSEHEERQS
jgi:hypothetical protein